MTNTIHDSADLVSLKCLPPHIGSLHSGETVHVALSYLERKVVHALQQLSIPVDPPRCARFTQMYVYVSESVCVFVCVCRLVTSVGTSHDS